MIVPKYIELRKNKVIQNFGWLTALRLLQVLVTVFVGALVARTLGPEDYGKLSYTLAIVTILGTVAKFGLENIVKKELILHPERENQIIGTAYFLKLGGAFAIYSLFGVYAYSTGTDQIGLLLLLVGTQLFYEVSLVIDYWFQSQVRAKYAVLTITITIVVISVARLGLVYVGGSLNLFAFTYVLHAFLGHFLLLRLYTRQGGQIKKWCFDLGTAKNLLRRSWPLIFNSLNAMVYTRVDQIMLSHYRTFSEVGTYSAAARILEICMIFPMALGASFLPSIINSSQKSETIYHEKVKRYFAVNAVAGFLVMFFVALLSGPIIKILFGTEFRTSALLLKILSLGILFKYMIAARGHIFVSEDLLKLSMISSSCGVIVNLGANILLIPKFGVFGAAFATLLSLASTLFLVFMYKSPYLWIGRALLTTIFFPLRHLPHSQILTNNE